MAAGMGAVVAGTAVDMVTGMGALITADNKSIQ